MPSSAWRPRRLELGQGLTIGEDSQRELLHTGLMIGSVPLTIVVVIIVVRFTMDRDGRDPCRPHPCSRILDRDALGARQRGPLLWVKVTIRIVEAPGDIGR